MSVSLSLIVPAYNETERLPPYLDSIRCYLERCFPGDHEVLVIDDGSRDGTSAIVEDRSASWPTLSLIQHPTNLGKGAAVRTGMLAARGRLLLFADADGATPIEEEAHLRRAIEEGGADIAVGSRRMGRSRRDPARALYGRLFSGLVRAALPIPIADTQCGFKMFRYDVAKDLFNRCHEDGYLFDLQILALAVRRGYRLAEAGIRWSEVPGSKVRLVRDSWRMLTGLPRLRRATLATDKAPPKPNPWPAGVPARLP